MAGRQSSMWNQRSRNAGDRGNGGTPGNGGDASVTTTGQTIGTATGTLVGLPGTPGYVSPPMDTATADRSTPNP
jgi:hypothetical protein